MTNETINGIFSSIAVRPPPMKEIVRNAKALMAAVMPMISPLVSSVERSVNRDDERAVGDGGGDGYRKDNHPLRDHARSEGAHDDERTCREKASGRDRVGREVLRQKQASPRQN